MDYILGVDGGGTKTVVQIADCSGKLLAENESSPGSYKSVGAENAKANINNAVLGAIKKLKTSDKIIFKSAFLDWQEMIPGKIKIFTIKLYLMKK